MRIVLADDHPLVRAGIRTTLEEREGIELVAEATDGDEALQAVLEHRPDLLLLDLTMPGLTTGTALNFTGPPFHFLRASHASLGRRSNTDTQGAPRRSSRWSLPSGAESAG